MCILYKINLTVRPVNIFSNEKQLICANVCPYKHMNVIYS